MEDFEKQYNYKILKEIGRGAFGSVYKIMNKNDKKIYALKKIVLTGQNKVDLDSIKNEALILKTINNENIVKFYDSFFFNNSFYLIMEYCGNSDLKSFINKHKNKNQLISEIVINVIIKGLCNGIKAIHDKKLIHRDLKPENIFISDDYNIKIGDFGISKILNGTNYAQTFAGSLSYMAPEMINGKKYNNKVDIWSFGCIIYELSTCKICFSDESIINLVNKINSGVHGKIDTSHYTDGLQNLIDLSLKADFKERGSIEDIINYYREKNFNLDDYKKMYSILPNDIGLNMINNCSGGEIEKLFRKEEPKTKWLDYINYMLLNKKDDNNIYNNNLSIAGIIGVSGILWAWTPNFPRFNEKEIKCLNDIFKQKSNSVSYLTINNKNYQITNYKIGFSIDLKSGDQGGTIAKTNLAFIIGFYDKNKFYKINGEKHNQCLEICNKVVEDLATRLKELNY